MIRVEFLGGPLDGQRMDAEQTLPLFLIPAKLETRWLEQGGLKPEDGVMVFPGTDVATTVPLVGYALEAGRYTPARRYVFVPVRPVGA